MSYSPNQPPYAPYGQPPPQGYPPYPQQPYSGPPPAQGYNPPPGPPPQDQYGQPQYPPPQGQFSQPPQGQYPPPQHPPPQGGYYGAPPPQGYPPAGYPPAGYPPAPGQAPYPGQGYPSASGPYGQYPPPQQPPFPQQSAAPQGPPAPPSPGYTPGEKAHGDYREQAEILRKAMKGFGTNEKALIHVLSNLDPFEVEAVRLTYRNHIGRGLAKDVESETSGSLKAGLMALVHGPLLHDVNCANEAIRGIGTKEWLLNDILLGRSNADIKAIKAAYRKTFFSNLDGDVSSDLSFKTEGLFKTVLSASRHEESTPINPDTIEAEVRTLHGATSGRMVNDVSEVSGIFARSSDNEIRAIDQAFKTRYQTSLENWIEKEFSGHMEDAFLHILRTATNPAMRDAIMLEDAMKGMGTDDEKLVIRTVRMHWNRSHVDQIKRAYRQRFGADLIGKIKSETSGDYEKLMVALLE